MYIFDYANPRNKVPDNKSQEVKDFLKEMGVTVKVKKQSHIPNDATIEAMDELKAGKGIKFNSVNELFNSI